MVSGDTSLKYKAQVLKLSFLLASCDFIQLKEFLPTMSTGAFDYELQRRVYNYYCNGKLYSDTITALENYGKATQLVLDELGISNNSDAAAFDLLYVTHNYISKQRLVFYIDSIGEIFDNEILQGYNESKYHKYKRQTNCEILPW